MYQAPLTKSPTIRLEEARRQQLVCWTQRSTVACTEVTQWLGTDWQAYPGRLMPSPELPPLLGNFDWVPWMSWTKDKMIRWKGPHLKKTIISGQLSSFALFFSHEEAVFTFKSIPYYFWRTLDSSDSFSVDVTESLLLQEPRFSLSKPRTCFFQAVGFKFREFQLGQKNLQSTFEWMAAQIWPLTHSDYSLPSRRERIYAFQVESCWKLGVIPSWRPLVPWNTS